MKQSLVALFTSFVGFSLEEELLEEYEETACVDVARMALMANARCSTNCVVEKWSQIRKRKDMDQSTYYRKDNIKICMRTHRPGL
jgi:hypothetical protein